MERGEGDSWRPQCLETLRRCPMLQKQLKDLMMIPYFTCTHIWLILAILTPKASKHLLHLTATLFQLFRTADPSTKNAGSKKQRTNVQHPEVRLLYSFFGITPVADSKDMNDIKAEFEQDKSPHHPSSLASAT